MKKDLNEMKKIKIKIIEDYFMYKALWHELTEAEAKELFSILEQAKNDKY
ncbi:unnamed protein product [marine sediment metagenome]|uniref:Uncharacterized protein n=1 Tax=marine sediment metagenome TaxID=412755 RepID=X1F6J9_9ZZZZ